MDPTSIRIERGKPVPDWDAAHRLSTAGNAGPECYDSGTIFRVNSVFMDVSDAAHNQDHWLPATLALSPLVGALFYVAWLVVAGNGGQRGGWFEVAVAALAGLVVACFVVGGRKWSYLTRRPVRLNRLAGSLHGVTRRRFFAAPGLGDHTWEIPWTDETVFCVHRHGELEAGGARYHIRAYLLNQHGLVVQGVAIGREFRGLRGLADLLSQWNYWCLYMNRGPEHLPRPLLFLSEREGLFESLHYCLNEFGAGRPPWVRFLMLPYFLALTWARVLTIRMLRGPRWPAAVLDISRVAADDPYRQPVPGTPVGLTDFLKAAMEQGFPMPDSARTPDWRGENDSETHARRWETSDTRTRS